MKERGRKVKSFIYFVLFFFSSFSLFAYDAGDIINSVKRSQSVVSVFLDRWSIMQNSYSFEELSQKSIEERFYYINRGGYSHYIDLFLHGENVPSFPIKTQFGGGKAYETTFFRVATSAIFRLQDLIETDYFKWGFAIGLAGFRYGMYTDIKMHHPSTLPDGTTTNLVSFESREYLYSQIYDDLIVLTNIFKPFGYLHLGLLINRQLDPGIDGLIGNYDDKLKTVNRLFVNSDLLGTLNLNLAYDSKKEKTDFFSTSLELFSIFSKTTDWIERRFVWPDIYLGYSYYGNQLDRPRALHTVFLDFFYNIYTAFTLKFHLDAFLFGKTEQEKDYFLRSGYFEFGFQPANKDYHERIKNNQYSSFELSYYLLFGLSYFLEPRLLEFNSEEKYVTGFCLGFKVNFWSFLGGITLEGKVSRNYAPKLIQMIEMYDNIVLELSLQYGF